MRDRLIELLHEANNIVKRNGFDYNANVMADYLIKNGVVVLQCKIGDTVYQTDGIRIYELEVFDVSIRKNKPYYETESVDFDEDAIGKTVFLTREDAEKALRGEKVTE